MQIIGNMIRRVWHHGIDVQSGASNLVMSGNCIDAAGQNGINCRSLRNSIISANTIRNCGTRSLATNSNGINLWSGNTTDNVISNNRIFDDQAAQTQSLGIRKADSSARNMVSGNAISGNIAAMSTFSATDVIHHNTGYITQARGIAIFTNGTTSTVVAHGMNRVPAIVSVTPLDADTRISSAYVPTISSSTFTIKASIAIIGNPSVYWYAEV